MTWYLDCGPESDVVLSSRVRLARNLTSHPFTARLKPEEAVRMSAEIRDAFYSANSSMRSLYRDIELPELSEIACQAMAEKRLISDELLQGKQRRKSQASRVIISNDESVSIMIGEEDHIRIQAMSPGLDLESTYRKAEEIAILIEEKMPVAYDEQFGFLTACPTNTGTGMRASVMLHLPGLTALKQISGLQRRLDRMGFTVRGAYGEHSKAEGDLYQISNQVTLGLSERDILGDFSSIVGQIIGLEREARKRLKDGLGIKLEDRVWRNLGILQQARQLTAQEALTRLSDIALGVELGYLQPPIDQSLVKRAMAGIGAGSIQQKNGREMDPAERDRYRATFIRNLLKNAATA